jgi:glucose-6-phosphate isomerase
VKKDILIIGFGASSLNIRALLSSSASYKANFHFLDSLDPFVLNKVLSSLDIAKAKIFVISKSGNTRETNILFEYILTKNPGEISILCENKVSILGKIAKNIDHKWIDYAQMHSGRFALLTKPFLDIIELAGINPNKLLEGSVEASEVDAAKISEEWLMHFENGRRNWVVMLYSQQLHGLFMWIRQIVSESLGKNGFGIFPILAEGTMDEHSQLQLFLDGPKDKFYDVISSDYSEYQNLSKVQIEHAYKITGMLKEKNLPVNQIHHERIDEIVIGKYIATYLSVVKILAAKLSIDPLTQPAVECMKQKSYEN